MGKYTRTAIRNIYRSWWLRGHLFVVILIGLFSYSLVSHPVATMALSPKQRGTVVYEHPTGTVLPTILPTRTVVKPSAIPTIRPTVKSVPTATATQAGMSNNPPAATPGNTRNWYPPACYSRVTQFYGQNSEAGTDFGCSYHTRIGALWNGKVIYAGRTCWNTSCTSTSGGVVIINAFVPTLGEESTYYLHLDTISPEVFVGRTVNKGQYIGLSGGQTSGGNWPASPWWSEGPHIEIGFDAWFLCEGMVYCSGKNVNPLPYIREAM